MSLLDKMDVDHSNDSSLFITSEVECKDLPYQGTRAGFKVMGRIKSNAVSNLDLTQQPQNVYEALRTAKRAPVELIAVVDVSGSMDEQKKLELTKEALEFIIDLLLPQDRLCIITFSHIAGIALPFTSMNEEGKNIAKNVVRCTRAMGGTSLVNAMALALSQLPRQENKVFGILLLTDGEAESKEVILASIQSTLATLEATHTSKLSEKYKQYAINVLHNSLGLPSELVLEIMSFQGPLHSHFFTINTFGFGTDNHPDVLRAIAQTKHGMYHYVSDSKAIGTTVAECLAGLLSVVGQDIILKIEPLRPGVVVENVFTRFPTQKVNNCHYVKMGDLQKGEERELICSVSVPACEAPVKNYPLLKFSAVYSDVLRDGYYGTSTTAVITRADAPTTQAPNPAVDIRYNTHVAMQGLVEAAKSGTIAPIDGAIQAIASSASAGQCRLLVEELQSVRSVFQKKSNEGRCYLHTQISSHMYQRASVVESAGQEQYRTNMRRGMQISYRAYMQMKYQQKKTKVVCDVCGETGHYWKDCTQGSKQKTEWQKMQDQKRAREADCFICNSKGHFARDCPKNKKSQPLECYVCHGHGHFASACPYDKQPKAVGIAPAPQTIDKVQPPQTCWLTLRGLPFRGTDEKRIAQFFSGCAGLVEKSIELEKNDMGKLTGIAYVEFNSRENAENAQRMKNKQSIGDRYVEIQVYGTYP